MTVFGLPGAFVVAASAWGTAVLAAGWWLARAAAQRNE
jgi:hypothetical protein